MKQPHKHAELIKAWADGAEVEALEDGEWVDVPNPHWFYERQYRIKSEPKPDVVRWVSVNALCGTNYAYDSANMKLTYCGETGKLKKAEVLG